jgi:hypothetical protein
VQSVLAEFVVVHAEADPMMAAPSAARVNFIVWGGTKCWS